MIKLYDRIKETTYTIGTGDILLSGPVLSFASFASAYNNNEAFFYTITDGTRYEIGSGSYISSNNSIKRFPVKSTNNDELVNFPEGLKEIFVNYPATNSIFNTSGTYQTPQNSGIAFWTSSNSISYTDKLVYDSGNIRIGINKSNPSYSIDIGGNGHASNVKASGFIVGSSGIYFASGNGDLSSYSGGRQLFHFEPLQIVSPLSYVVETSGIVNQNLLLKKQNANMIFSGPSGGCVPPCGPDYPTFRNLVQEDIPNLSFLYYPFPSAVLLSGILNNTIIIVSGIAESASGYLETKINSASGALNNRITSASGYLDTNIHSASGALNNRITSVSGYLDTKINNLSFVDSTLNFVNNGRLSLNSTNSTFDGSNNSLYFVPHCGNTISLIYNSEWNQYSFNSSLVSNFASLNSNSIYDVFVFWNSSSNSVNFELEPWTMYSPPNEENPDALIFNSYRSVGISKIQGVWCKTINSTRRYIGTIKTDSTSFTDNQTKRFICNIDNKVNKTIRSSVNINSDPSFIFNWIYAGNLVRKIPYIPQIEVISGLDSEINLKIILDCQIPYVRCFYTLGIARNPEVFIDDISDTSDEDVLYYINNDAYFYDYASVMLKNTYGQVTSDTLSGDSQDAIIKTLSASIKCRPVGYEKYYGVELTSFGSPIVLGNNLMNDYGIMGTYEC